MIPSSKIYVVICLVVTLLTNIDTDALLLFGNTNYTMYRNDRKSHEGGVAIICKQNLHPCRVNCNEFNDIEKITLVLQSSSEIRVTCLY